MFYQSPFIGYPYQFQEPRIEPKDLNYNESSYIENILRLNLGKLVTIYMNFENSTWGSKAFKGILEAAGKDHIIISDPNNETRYLLLTIYLDYIVFDEEINYVYPYQK